MRINTNIASLNAQRTLANTGAAAAKTIGRLSSGFRINSASDDAAGLGIANKLRADLRSMKQASRNAEQATAMLQVAEGATQTIQNVLERMKELATQSASDNTDAAGRGRINDEFTALKAEIERIVDTTKFQGSHLLKTVAATAAVDPTNASSASLVALTAANAGIASSTVGASATAGEYQLVRDGTDVNLQYRANSSGTFATIGTAEASDTITVNGLSIVLDADISTISESTPHGFTVTGATTGSPAVDAIGGDRHFMVSSSAEYVSGSNPGADFVTLSGLNLTLEALDIEANSLDSADNARAALSNIDSALATVASAFGDIGAAQNRMEYASQNVKSAIENISAAESTIRDADMASEMSTFTRQQILQQAGVAMLAQANSAPQQILRLLQ